MSKKNNRKHQNSKREYAQRREQTLKNQRDSRLDKVKKRRIEKASQVMAIDHDMDGTQSTKSTLDVKRKKKSLRRMKNEIERLAAKGIKVKNIANKTKLESELKSTDVEME